MKKRLFFIILTIALIYFLVTFRNSLSLSFEPHIDLSNTKQDDIYEDITRRNQEAKNNIQNTTLEDKQEIENEVNQIKKELVKIVELIDSTKNQL